MSDIAARAGVAPEAVRLWAARKRRASLRPFPAPHQVVGTGSGGKPMSLYAWREILSWIREILGTDPDEGIEYLSDTQLADLNVDIAAIRAERAVWQPIAVDNEQIIADMHQVCQQARVSFVTASFAGNSASHDTRGPDRKLHRTFRDHFRRADGSSVLARGNRIDGAAAWLPRSPSPHD